MKDCTIWLGDTVRNNRITSSLIISGGDKGRTLIPSAKCGVKSYEVEKRPPQAYFSKISMHRVNFNCVKR